MTVGWRGTGDWSAFVGFLSQGVSCGPNVVTQKRELACGQRGCYLVGPPRGAERPQQQEAGSGHWIARVLGRNAEGPPRIKMDLHMPPGSAGEGWPIMGASEEPTTTLNKGKGPHETLARLRGW